MPTGYTAPLYEGKDISFEEFMLRCSRAMMPAVLLRDHDADVLPTEENVVEGDYYPKRLVEAQAEYLRVSELTAEEAEAECDVDFMAALERHREANLEAEERVQRYEEMLAKVEAWEPPTGDHEPLKKFVCDQLRDSMKFDSFTLAPPQGKTAAQWKEDRLAELGRDIERAHEEIQKTAERNLYRTRWIKALRDSLEGVPA